MAIAAHHDVWWPGVVTVLDERWRRTGTFVNAGWIERVQWTSPNRLLVSGFSNARDAGMAALLDDQSPEPAGRPYHCLTCGPGAPLRYVIFPRSLDLLSASYSDRDWDLHKALEAEGKIHYTRAQCPDRDGPREIQVWEPATGWRTVNTTATSQK